LKFREAPLVEAFDPNGDGYDIDTALAAGATPDEGHWQSLDPRTGMVLKGRNHPTWGKTIEVETELGNTVAQAEDGRYYSTKQPNFRSAPLADEDPDTPENFAERAKKDYDFAIENNVEFGFGDSVRREWGTRKGLEYKTPFAGSLMKALDNQEMVATIGRIKEPDGYQYLYAEESAFMADPMELAPMEEWVDNFQKSDKKAVSDYLKYITADKTLMAKITGGVSQLPTWFIEFAATGGLASIGDDIAIKAGEKILKGYANTAAGKVALRAAGWSSGAFTRSFGLATQIGEKYTQQSLDEVLGLEEEAGWGTKLARGWGDVYIESLSESLFGMGKATLIDEGAILKGLSKLPLGKKIFPKMKSAWMQATGGTAGQFIKRMTSKGGYSNIIGEIGEERLGTLLRAIANVDDFGLGENSTILERLKAGFTQDVENMWVELGVLSFPAGVQYVGGKALDRKRMDKVRTELGGKSEELAKEEESARKVRELIDSEVEKQPDKPIEAKLPVEQETDIMQELSAQSPNADGFRVIEMESTEQAMEAAKQVADKAKLHGIDIEIRTEGGTLMVKELTPKTPVEGKAPEGATITPQDVKTPQIDAQKAIDTAQKLSDQTGNTVYVQDGKVLISKPDGESTEIKPQAEQGAVGKQVKNVTLEEYKEITKDETVDSAATLFDSGRVGTGNMHFQIQPKQGEEIASEGFLTSSGRYVSREEAAMLTGGNYWESVADGSQEGSTEGVLSTPEEVEGKEVEEFYKWANKQAQPTPQAEQGAVEPIKQVNPTKIKDANLVDEVDNVVGQLMTNRADPSKTSLRQEDVQEGRKILGLDGVASATRKSQLKDLQIAKDQGYVDNAEDNANRALGGGEQLNRLEAAGALVRMVQLLSQYKAKKALLAKATENLSIATLNTEMERIVNRYDSLSTAVHRSGSEAGRRLAMQKLTIDENYDYVSVVTRYKARKGKKPTHKQDANLKKLTDELAEKDRTIERLRVEVAEAMAKDFLRKGKVARYSSMNRAEVLSEQESIISAITELLDEGC